jgi:hypothetical protein
MHKKLCQGAVETPLLGVMELYFTFIHLKILLVLSHQKRKRDAEIEQYLKNCSEIEIIAFIYTVYSAETGREVV